MISERTRSFFKYTLTGGRMITGQFLISFVGLVKNAMLAGAGSGSISNVFSFDNWKKTLPLLRQSC